MLTYCVQQVREIGSFMSQSCNDGSEMYKLKCVMHVQVCCFANLKLSGFFSVLVTVTFVVA